jgi:hypothetical protein
MAHHEKHELSAFCSMCLLPEEVSHVLERFGFVLGFTLPAEDDGAYMHLPPLPAQFHYDGPGGMRVIYLAGPDMALDGECFPEHQSRFWLCRGHDHAAFQRIASVLAVRWSLMWQRREPSGSLHDAA